MFITLWVTVLSILLIVGLERHACRIRGKPLSAWQRWLIPLPIILLLGWNLHYVLSLQAWLETPSHIRYGDKQGWDSSGWFYAGFISALLIPFTMSNTFRRMGCIVPVFWFGYFLWLIFVWAWVAPRQ